MSYARTVARVPDQRKWDASAIEGVRSIPYSLHATPETTVTFPSKGDPETPAVAKPSLARRVYIKASDYDDHGLTDGCPRCESIKRYGPGRSTRPHSEMCRARIVAELMKTPEGKARIDSANALAEKSIAEQIERAQDPSAMGESRDVGGGDQDIAPLKFEDKLGVGPGPEVAKESTPIERASGSNDRHNYVEPEAENDDSRVPDDEAAVDGGARMDDDGGRVADSGMGMDVDVAEAEDVNFKKLRLWVPVPPNISENVRKP